MKNKATALLLAFLLAAPFLFTGLSMAQESTLSITLKTDAQYYQSARLINILGYCSDQTGSPIENVTVGLQVEDPGNNTVFLDTALSTSNGSYEDSFRLQSSTPLGKYQVYAVAVKDDYTTAANQATFDITIPGDINGDFRVTLADLVYLANAYGTTPASGGIPGTPHAWNPNADIDGNGVVGLTDLVILALHYAQHYP